MRLVVADIGGTKTLLALALATDTGWRFEHRSRVASQDHAALADLIAHWLQSLPVAVAPDAMGLALAGPVRRTGNRTHGTLTNLPWPPVDSAELERRFGMPVTLINDFAAIGLALYALGPEDQIDLQRAEPEPEGLRLVVGAGTGLGTCLVGPAPAQRVYPGEGGHADFSPADAWQAGFAEWVRERMGRCSRESVLSGSGIGRIATFLHAQSPDRTLAEALAAPDPAAAITAGAARGDPGALRVVERFVSMYGGQLGDIALAALPKGGVFVAGGIAPRWSTHFQTPIFIDSFRNKPPMQALLSALPLRLIVHPEPGLLGAAVAARGMLEPAGESQ
ncbi:MAG TPA: ROK family protein [Thioalkalivibrio sp.]|nr:ROK family protein [Thioalkalivibrio sp.]